MDFSKERIKEEKNKEVTLVIKPQVPLSIAGKDYGLFYRNTIKPNPNKIFGMLENVMGLWFDNGLRSKVKKGNKGKKDKTFNGNKAYYPVIDDFIEGLEIVSIPKDYNLFDDLTTTMRNIKEDSHFWGVRNFDISHINTTRKHDKKKGEVSLIEGLDKIEKEAIFDKFPEYYMSITKREYIDTEDEIVVKFKTTEYLYNKIKDALYLNKSAYLGTSESIVNLEIR